MRSKDSQNSPKVSIRTCCACRKEAPPNELIRWVRDDDGFVVPDLAARSFGRGAWTHPRRECLKSLRSSLQRSFRAAVSTTSEDALLLLGRASEHRVRQLLGLARRRNLLVYGTDATGEAWSKGQAYLILVARDALAAAKSPFVSEAVKEGRGSAWGTKAEFGRLFGRAEVGVLGVRDRDLARGLFGAIAMALLVQEPSQPR